MDENIRFSGTQGRPVVDPLLTGVSQKLVLQSCVADLVLPEVPVKMSSGKIGKYGKEHLRIVTSIVGGKGKFRSVDTVTRSSDSYIIEDHGLEDMVTQKDYDNVVDPFDADADVTSGLTSILQVEKEYALASVLGDTAVMTQNTILSSGAQWNDYANSDPIANINLAKETIRDGCGMVSDLVAICDWKIANKLRFHPQILQALGFAMNRAGQLTNEELAKVFEVKRFLVPDAVYLSSKEGQADVTAPVWGKNFILAQIPEKAAKMQVTLGYKLVMAGQGVRKVYKYPVNNPPGANMILCQDSYDQLITNVGAGYLIKNAIA